MSPGQGNQLPYTNVAVNSTLKVSWNHSKHFTDSMSDLENAMVTIIETFHKYSGREGDKLKLKKMELKELINNELSNFIGVSMAKFIFQE
ncbi:hypothetical protein scyTo_0017509 [Scyliorhinus torazame]|uniref:S100/CaBP-9k-type calcium binding subdomain domain-containing protein n=1 Tax=Scyliorhinus torazame TaxID=75743 RepID=A0A401PUL4_SCYTO|nr:hypothetical protein [Scyliorhinus torazame]